MKFHKNLYTHNSIKNKKRLLYKLRLAGKVPSNRLKLSVSNIMLMRGHYALCTGKGAGLLTILSFNDVLKPVNQGYTIIGIAKGKDNAVDLTQTIMQDHHTTYQSFSNFSETWCTL